MTKETEIRGRTSYFVLDTTGWRGLREFSKKQDALDFITGHMAEDVDKTITDYTLIVGQMLELRAVEVVVKIEA